MLSRAFYRVGQLRRALNPNVTPSERDAARNTLGSLYPLFEAMPATDQRHCIDTFEALLMAGHTEPEMLQAALIHDAGKAGDQPIGVPDRVAYVALSPIPPLLRFAIKFRPGLRALEEHGERTLQLAREAGASDDVVALLEQMEGVRPPDERGRALKRADDST